MSSVPSIPSSAEVKKWWSYTSLHVPSWLAQTAVIYSHAPHNDVSVNDGPHIRRRSHNIVI